MQRVNANPGVWQFCIGFNNYIRNNRYMNDLKYVLVCRINAFYSLIRSFTETIESKNMNRTKLQSPATPVSDTSLCML